MKWNFGIDFFVFDLIAVIKLRLVSLLRTVAEVYARLEHCTGILQWFYRLRILRDLLS